eukprot:6661906-Prymnesium_polylepis.1
MSVGSCSWSTCNASIWQRPRCSGKHHYRPPTIRNAQGGAASDLAVVPRPVRTLRASAPHERQRGSRWLVGGALSRPNGQ